MSQTFIMPSYSCRGCTKVEGELGLFRGFWNPKKESKSEACPYEKGPHAPENQFLRLLAPLQL